MPYFAILALIIVTAIIYNRMNDISGKRCAGKKCMSKWENYIKNTISRKRPMRPLHYMSKLLWNAAKTGRTKRKPRALSLGTGDGM